jgi:adenine/guanine phosphoribosyltransferase-like PRPP-binding protein
VSLQLRVVNPPAMAGIVTRCASDGFELRDREGRTGRGFTNLKRMLGRPADFAFVVGQLARTVPSGHAVAACDEGAWALVGAIALHLGVPAVLVRRVPKTYFVSYGDDPAAGDGRLAGERLRPGTPIHLVDDLVFSGQTVRSARDALRLVGLDAARFLLLSVVADSRVLPGAVPSYQF